MTAPYRLTRERVQELLEAQRWTYAKTMPSCPHFWALRKWFTEERELWEAMCAFMFDPANSDVEPWGKGRWRRNVRYFRVGAYRYWANEGPGGLELDLLNRAVEPGHPGYAG